MKRFYLPFVFPVLAVGLMLALLSPPPRALAQAGPYGASFYGCVGGSSNGNYCSYSPSQLGMNAVTLPLSSTTGLSNIIDTRGAREFTLLWACTQNAHPNIQVYAEDGATTVFGPQVIVTSEGVAGDSLAVGSEVAPSTLLNKTIAVPIRLPQRALAFQFGNETATAGTCTARLFVEY